MKMSGMWGAYLIIVGLTAGLIWLLRREPVQDTFKSISVKLHPKMHIVISIIIVCLALAVLRFTPVWEQLVAYATPPQAVTMVYQDVVKENLYITQTNNPSFTVGKYKYRLLVEFGVRRNSRDLDIEINTGCQYQLLKEWWDEPFQTNKTQDSLGIEDSIYWNNGGTITIGKLAGVARDYSNPPIYRLSGKIIQITTDRSYYAYFESESPLQVKSARFGDSNFISVNGDLVKE